MPVKSNCRRTGLPWDSSAFGLALRGPTPTAPPPFSSTETGCLRASFLALSLFLNESRHDNRERVAVTDGPLILPAGSRVLRDNPLRSGRPPAFRRDSGQRECEWPRLQALHAKTWVIHARAVAQGMRFRSDIQGTVGLPARGPRTPRAEFQRMVRSHVKATSGSARRHTRVDLTGGSPGCEPPQFPDAQRRGWRRRRDDRLFDLARGENRQGGRNAASAGRVSSAAARAGIERRAEAERTDPDDGRRVLQGGPRSVQLAHDRADAH